MGIMSFGTHILVLTDEKSNETTTKTANMSSAKELVMSNSGLPCILGGISI